MRLTVTRAGAALLGACLALGAALLPINSAEAAPTATPSITVTEAPRDGGEVTITGTGFDTTGSGIYIGIAKNTVEGIYGHSGEFVGAENGGDFMTNGAFIWLYPKQWAAAGGSFAGAQPLGDDGSFTVTMKVPAFEEGITYAVYTSKAHGAGATDPSNDTKTDIAWEAPVPVCENPLPERTYVGSGDTLTWGVKESFRSYVTGSIASGSIALGDGAKDAGEKGYAFPEGMSVYSMADHHLFVRFAGSVHFTGHDGKLDLMISGLTLDVPNGKEGTLYAHVSGTTLEGATFDVVDMPLAAVALGGSRGTFTSSSVTLTEDGSKAFSGFYPAGQELDALSFTFTMDRSAQCMPEIAPLDAHAFSAEAPAVDEPAPGEEPGTDEEPAAGEEPAQGEQPAAEDTPAEQVTPTEDEQPAAADAAAAIVTPTPVVKAPTCEVNDDKFRFTGGTFSWGVKESFTTYVRGSIANGSWTTTGGVSWDGDSQTFAFPIASGAYDRSTGAGRVSMGGSVHFTGHGGILDLTIANPTLVIDGRNASLYAAVSSKDMNTQEMVNYGRILLATSTVSVSPALGTSTIEAGSSALTSTGAKAFANFYEAGQELSGFTARITTSAGTSCDPVTGELIDHTADTLASTGADAADALALAGLMFALGGAVLVSRRRLHLA